MTYPDKFYIPWQVLHTLTSITYPGKYYLPWQVWPTLTSITFPGKYYIPWQVLPTLTSMTYPDMFYIPWQVLPTLTSITYPDKYNRQVLPTLASITYPGKYYLPWQVLLTLASITSPGIEVSAISLLHDQVELLFTCHIIFIFIINYSRYLVLLSWQFAVDIIKLCSIQMKTCHHMIKRTHGIISEQFFIIFLKNPVSCKE